MCRGTRRQPLAVPPASLLQAPELSLFLFFCPPNPELVASATIGFFLDSSVFLGLTLSPSLLLLEICLAQTPSLFFARLLFKLVQSTPLEVQPLAVLLQRLPLSLRCGFLCVGFLSSLLGSLLPTTDQAYSLSCRREREGAKSTAGASGSRRRLAAHRSDWSAEKA